MWNSPLVWNASSREVLRNTSDQLALTGSGRKGSQSPDTTPHAVDQHLFSSSASVSRDSGAYAGQQHRTQSASPQQPRSPLPSVKTLPAHLQPPQTGSWNATWQDQSQAQWARQQELHAAQQRAPVPMSLRHLNDSDAAVLQHSQASTSPRGSAPAAATDVPSGEFTISYLLFPVRISSTILPSPCTPQALTRGWLSH